MTKKRIREVLKKILHSYGNGEILDDKDTLLLELLLKGHTSYEQKLGVGIKHFTVRDNIYGNRCFWLYRKDGTDTDFSYYKLISEPSNKSYFSQACRWAVRQQIIDFRDRQETFVCELTGEELKRENVHIDHAPPNTFANIVNSFIDEYKIDIDDIELTGNEDNVQHVAFTGKSLYLDDQFKKYHLEKSNLRVLKDKINLKLAKV